MFLQYGFNVCKQNVPMPVIKWADYQKVMGVFDTGLAEAFIRRCISKSVAFFVIPQVTKSHSKLEDEPELGIMDIKNWSYFRAIERNKVLFEFVKGR